MERSLALLLCLALFTPLAEAQTTSKRQEQLEQYRRLLGAYDCRDRMVGVQGLLDEVPPKELFDTAWECAEAEYADSDTRSAAREAVAKLDAEALRLGRPVTRALAAEIFRGE